MPRSENLVECRIPTFRRPELLARAINSLRCQTRADWRAIVLDDCPAGGGAEAVVASFGDHRILYRASAANKGAAANLDQAFSPDPLAGGSVAFVLEDDNALEPAFIETGLKCLEDTGRPIISFNQRRVDIGPDGRESRGGLLREGNQPHEWDRERILLNAFLGIGLPNGGYFWRLAAPGLDLRIGPEVDEPQFQECLRQLKVTSRILLRPEPLSLWSMLPGEMIRRNPVSDRRLAANLNRLSRAVANFLGAGRLEELARRHLSGEMMDRFRQNKTDLSLLSPVLFGNLPRDPVGALTAAIRFHLYRDCSSDVLERLVCAND